LKHQAGETSHSRPHWGTRLRPAAAPLAIALLTPLGLDTLTLASREPDDITWADDIAPIVFENCVGCHFPGGSGPFALTSHEEAAQRADRIARAVASGHMPPWLPDANGPRMVGERHLSPDEIDLFARWADAGAPRGDAKNEASLPKIEGGWPLGAPDLTVAFPSYVTPAEGGDIYRNLVVSLDLEQPVWVRTIDLQPGNARVVHHARFMVDTTSSSRERDAADPDATGFDGMHLGTFAGSPDGFFVGWTPGRVPDPGRDDLAWRLDPGTDLVLQVHLRPTGEPETVQPRLGLYLSDTAPTELPVVIMLENKNLDIPAGDSAWIAEERFTTPVDVEALTIYPHAHYIGRRINSWAELPSGERRTLLSIDDWDFNWQDQYRYAEPVQIPAGSEIVMQWSFDNSAANPRNPFAPARRIMFGPESTDEMAELNVQVLPRDPADRPALVAALRALYRTADAHFMAHSARDRADALAQEGRWSDALATYREALLEANDPAIMERMAAMLVALGDGPAAVLVAEQSAALGGRDARLSLTLARAYRLVGRVADARATAASGVVLANQLAHTALADSLNLLLGEIR